MFDFFMAQAFFEDISHGRQVRLSRVQTRHATDNIISDFTRSDSHSAGTLVRWMQEGESAIFRVNSAGILAKGADGGLADVVVRALRRDPEARHLYVAAVAARILGVRRWEDALSLGRSLENVGDISGSHAARISRAFSRELGNPTDAGARWSSIVALGGLGEVALAAAAPALTMALHDEPSNEIRSSIQRVLIGGDPLTV